MPVDASIAMGVRAPQIENPLNALAQAMQLQGMQRQGELQGLQVQQAKQGMADEQAARQVISANQDAAPQDLIRKLRVVNPAMAQKMEAAQIDADLKRSQTKEHSAKGDELVAKMAKAKQDQMAAMAGSLSSLDQVPEFLNQMVAESSGKVTPDQVKKLQAAFAADFQGTKQRLLEQAMSPDALQKMRQPDFVEMFDGKNKFFFDRNPFSTTPDNKRRMGEVQMQATIAEQEQARTNRAREAAAFTSAGAAASNARTSADRLRWEQANPTMQVVDGASGPMLVPTRGNGAAVPVTLDGKPVGPKMDNEQKKEIRDIDSQKATTANAIKAVTASPEAFGFMRGSATAISPMLDSAVGKVVDTPAAREARAFVMNNMSSIMKERAGTAQSKQEAALVRSFLPSETDDAEQVIGKLQAYQKYLDEKRGVYMAPAGQPPTVSATQEQKGGRSASGQVVQRVASDADYEKLPSGAVFVGPDGKRRTKP